MIRREEILIVKPPGQDGMRKASEQSSTAIELVWPKVVMRETSLPPRASPNSSECKSIGFEE